ncbi:MAG: ATP-binding protein [candidate division WOR-3 bacterium]
MKAILESKKIETNGEIPVESQTHVEKVFRKVISSLKTLNELSDLRVHAAIWTNWAVGKTHTAKKISKELKKEVFYIKIPDTDMSENKLLRMFGIALGCGTRHRLEEMLDLLEGHARGARLTQAMIIFDEAQRLWTKPRLLSWLKDLSENDFLQFIYIFVGDHHLPEKMARASHSLLERVKIRVQIEPVDESTVAHILQTSGAEKYVDILAMADYMRQTRRTTLDLFIIAKACAKSGKTLKNVEEIEKFVRQLGI